MARAILVLVLLASGCGVGLIGGSGSSAVELESIGLAGGTREACAVRLGDEVDKDGVADVRWQGRLEGDTLDNELTRVSYVTAVRERDGQTLRKRISVTLYEAE